jgi:HAMP domain-containing protein
VFVELQKHGGDLPAETRRDIKDRAGDYLRGLGLDVLILVETHDRDGGDDRILAAPHYRPMQDTVDRAPSARARATAGRAHYVREPVIRNGQVVPVLVASAAREFTQGRHRLIVVVGQEVGAGLLDTVRQPERIHARIVDAQGEVLVPPAQPWPTGAADVFRIPLPGPDEGGAPTAIIEAAISRADLERVLTQVTVASLVLAAGALVVTIVLGMFVARRMTRDLDRLVEGAQAAARGDLDHRVEVRARDEIGAVATSFNLMMADLETSKARLVMAERVAAGWRTRSRTRSRPFRWRSRRCARPGRRSTPRSTRSSTSPRPRCWRSRRGSSASSASSRSSRACPSPTWARATSTTSRRAAWRCTAAAWP